MLHLVIQEAVVTNLLKTGRQHVHQITAHKLCMFQSDHSLRIPGPPPGGESSRIFRKGKYPGIGNGYFMGIAPKVLYGIAKAVKGFLNVGTPVRLIKLIFPFLSIDRNCAVFAGRRKSKGTICVKGGKSCQIFTFELISQNTRGDKKVFGGFSDPAVFCQPAAGNNAVHVHAVPQLLVPCVEDLYDAECFATPFLIGS